MAAAEEVPLCPQGHALLPLRLDSAHAAVCDHCNRAFIDARQIRGCRVCDWDVCYACLTSAPLAARSNAQAGAPLWEGAARVRDPRYCHRCDGAGRKPLLFNIRGAGLFTRRCRSCSGAGVEILPGRRLPGEEERPRVPVTAGNLQAEQALWAAPPGPQQSASSAPVSVRSSRSDFLQRVEGVPSSTPPALQRAEPEDVRQRRRAFLDRMESHAPRGATYNSAEDNLCVVCLDRPIDCVLDPCGHVALCRACVRRLPTAGGWSGTPQWQRCPLCNLCIDRVLPLSAAQAR